MLMKLESKFLYRYRSFSKKILDSLTNDELPFSSPAYFNDQFEFRPVIDKTMLNLYMIDYLNQFNTKDKNLIYKTFINIQFNNAVLKTMEMLGVYYRLGYLTKQEKSYIFNIMTDYFCKADNVYSVRTINNFIEMIIATEFRDDTNISKEAELRYAIVEDKIISEFTKFRKSSKVDFYLNYMIDFYYMITIEKYHVACFSTDFDSPPMWGNYADSLTGFVVGYRIDDLVSSGVVYNEKNVSWCDFKPTGKGILKQVEYNDNGSEHHTLYVLDLFKHIIQYDILGKSKSEIKPPSYNVDYFYKKSFSWSYEKEWRIVKTSFEPLKIIPSVLYVGSRVADIDKKSILDLAVSKNIPCYFMIEPTYNSNSSFKFKRIV